MLKKYFEQINIQLQSAYGWRMVKVVALKISCFNWRQTHGAKNSTLNSTIKFTAVKGVNFFFSKAS